jgi:orotidine-5'-phosphate decarboxylase
MNAMSFRQRLAQINRRGHLCVGLDPQPDLLPHHVEAGPDGVGRFLGAVIEATSPYAVAYKPNAAFYEALGPWGWEILEALREVVPSDKLFILDAKRGDIGHTAQRYAHSAFQRICADAVTLSPYLGEDTLEPFLQEPNRGVFLLCLTSNPGAEQWQTAQVEGEPLFCRVARWAADIDRRQNIGLVAGATRPDSIAQIRAAAGDLPLLIPGIGAQEGDLSRTLEAACGAPFLINASRTIMNASRGRDFADAAAEAAAKLHRQIQDVEASLVGS